MEVELGKVLNILSIYENLEGTDLACHKSRLGLVMHSYGRRIVTLGSHVLLLTKHREFKSYSSGTERP